MADAKISALVDGTTPDDADDFVVARAGSTLKLTWAALKAAIGGSPPLHGWAAHWFNGGGWSVDPNGSWGTDDFEPTAIDWDTDGYADPDIAPTFGPKTPIGLGGIYLCYFTGQYACDTAGGFVGQNIGGSTRGQSWSPILGTAVADRQVATYVELQNLGEEDNSADVARLINFGENAISVYRADYWGVLIAPQPV